MEKINNVIKKLETRINDVRKLDREGGAYSGEGFANGIEFAVQELKETFGITQDKHSKR